MLHEKHIVLGVSGSIAAYKAADLASKLRQAGALVDVILTPSATRFVTPLTFQSVTGRKAYTDADLWGGEGHVVHVGLAEDADLMLIAPCTANTLAKLAHGQADTLLSLTALAARCPLLVAPAMDGGMFAHPATQANVETLTARGVAVLGPASGHLASGLRGVGRMLEPGELIGHVRLTLGRNGVLSGRRVVVTAGPTQEPLDPVRFLSNRSSGRQGFALAQAAAEAGAQVTLIAGPVRLETPVGVRRVDVHTAREMLAAVLAEIEQADLLLMAAAVADFRPAQTWEEKIKKGAAALQIPLAANPDILQEVAAFRGRRGFPRAVVGFAAESEALLENAQSKLARKRLDFIVANDITQPDAGFKVATNRVTLLFPDGQVKRLPLMSKDEVARHVVAQAAQILEAQ
ncbi:MAG: bifunctional phosphopantothenoylcysteine decarboxylase/phosphopantothenate--cysteine ligase CoaBC [Anaerolineae bacterium]|nr:MAG: bifunctional phosphopantothenoylcysteine decarboxylase/phosphopantothenate--cysteine ligase CoaBC [Anaerolineae bacterium]